jgi:hypothetical protein
MTDYQFELSQWTDINLPAFEKMWTLELMGIGEYTTEYFFLITGLLLPIWKRLDQTSLKVYRMTTDTGEKLLGRIIKPEVWSLICDSFSLTYQMSAKEIFLSLQKPSETNYVKLNWKYKIVRATVSRELRLEVRPVGGYDLYQDNQWFEAIGCFTEIIAYQLRVFLPNVEEKALDIIERLREKS